MTVVYTGCLRNGKIDNVALGPEPARPCGPGAEPITWNESGRDGATWYSGVTPPESALGSNGDFFLLLEDADSAFVGDVYIKERDTWITGATLRGPRGDQGPRGVEGPQGPRGETGVSGGVYFVRLSERRGIGGELLHLDVPPGLYMDAAGQISWGASAPVDSNWDGSISCRTNIGLAFGGGLDPPGGVAEVGLGSGARGDQIVEVGESGISVTCDNYVSTLEEGRVEAYAVADHTWFRITPVAHSQTYP